MSAQASQLLTKSFPQRFDLFSLVYANPERYPFLLESTAQQENTNLNTARYDILFAYPQYTLSKNAYGEVGIDGNQIPGGKFLPLLNQHWRQQRQQSSTQTDLPFRGGWFVYLSYELAGEIEPTLNLPVGDSRLPVAQATRIPAAVIYDRETGETTIVVEPDRANLLSDLEKDLFSFAGRGTFASEISCTNRTEDDPYIYLNQTRRVLDYIREGDVFQVNLSRQWQCRLVEEDMQYDLYQQLRVSNPAPFAGFAELNGGTIISSSPERLVRVQGDQVDTRPIAGTRPRLPTRNEDAAIQQELIQHPKERAEHVMLIDLERNDLGRICVPGTVSVDELMAIESYAHVHHIVSNVRGQLRPDISPGEVIAAVFPGGTITGCPKVRCMEIIAELEQTTRGPYTGSIGYLNHNGDMDLNILIRTMSVEQDRLRFRTGAGLVADSIPEHELEETRAKARGLLMVIEKSSS